MKSILTFTLLAISLLGYAQDSDYVVKVTDDTLYGNFESPIFSLGKKKLIAQGITYKFDGDSLKAYRKDGIIYRQIMRKGKSNPTWMECIEDGRIKLYQWVVKSGVGTSYGQTTITSTTWYMQKDNSPITELKILAPFGSKGRKECMETLRQFFSDNEQISKEYGQIKLFNYETIRVLINAYNRNAFRGY